MKSLDQIAIECETDRASVFTRTEGAVPHNYCVHYDRFFTAIRKEPIKLMEIGVAGGEGIKMWLTYFPKAKVFGVDNTCETNEWDTAGLAPEPRYKFVHGDQASQEFWAKFIEEHGADWDIVIDDGGHYANQVITTHNCLWPHLNPGGFYCIEDLNVSYPDLWPLYGDAFVKPPWISHMDFLKGKLDVVNRDKEIEWLHFSRELVIIKKALCG
jgi:hypothetical protein